MKSTSCLRTLVITVATCTDAFHMAFLPNTRTNAMATEGLFNTHLNTMSRMTFPHKTQRLYESTVLDVEIELSSNTVTQPIQLQEQSTLSSEAHVKPAKPAKAPKKSAGAGAVHKEGLFSPVVVFAKKVLGEEKLNKIRGDVITLHSDVIKSFVDTAETPIGQSVLLAMFRLADKNRNGQIEQEELAEFFQSLGFEWLKEKQIKGILERADTEGRGFLGLEEWRQEAPRTLRTNLVKLAKKNGGEMGLLV